MPISLGITRCNGFAAKSNQKRQEWGYCTPWVLHPHECCIFLRRKEPGLGGGESGHLEVPNVLRYLYPSAVVL
jgi:hypothetical protein